MSGYKPTIGLEIHAELKTHTKMFCNSKNDSDEVRPNVNVCPVCMAHPGTLPVINKEAVKHVLKVGVALGGKIADFTEFDRKNYFYPDIPKGYQISQYEYPLVSGGELCAVALTRIHLEEDTGSLIHADNPREARMSIGDNPRPNPRESASWSWVDFNRAGVPLMELVTEPVIDSAEKAGQFARELQLLLRTLGVSDANMEKGEMRVEANISVAKATETADERGLEARMDADRTKLLYEDITYKIRGAAFSVYNNLGSGHKESVYQNALEEELKNTGLSYEREKSIAVRYNGKEVGRYQPDFVIEGKILLELKALPFVGKKEKAQIKHYLEGSDYKLALLVNFGSHPIHIERIVYDIIRDNPPRSRISADNQRISAPLGVKVEVKNLNSFRSVERAILFEIERQSALLEEGEEVVQETRGWDETKQETFSQRIKEGSADYRYFPDPDLPSMLLSEIPECKYETIRSGLPELPWERRERYRSMKIADDDADMYVSNPTLGGFFEEVLDHLNGTEEQARLASNYIATDLVKLHRDIESRDTGYEGKIPISAKDFAKIITLVVEKKVSSRGAKDILALAVLEGGDPADIAEREGLFQKSSAKELGPIVANILSKHALVAEDYKKGNENALQFLVGQGMRATKGSADPIVLKKMFVDTIGAL